MTDGILLQEAVRDPLFSRYDVLVLDEVHERGLNTDFALGLAKRAILLRDDLRLVVMSATIDAEKFADFFGGAPIISVEGRMYPVEIRYIELCDIDGARALLNPKHGQEIEAFAAYMVDKIHRSGMPGDILVFMPGEAEIHRVIRHLELLNLTGLTVLGAYGSMNPNEQRKIFERVPGRKIVVATNIAETSITIDGIVHVIDSGLIKESNFDPETGIGTLKVVEHSKAGLKQREGRAGRTQRGVCWRLFTKEEHDNTRWQFRRSWNDEKRPEYTKPEIQRSDLAGVVLRLAGIGVKDVENFDYLDTPSFEALHEAVETLQAIGAVTPDREVTEIGKKLLDIPLDPKIGRMVLEAEKFGCVKEIAAIAAKLSVRNFFNRPENKKHEADTAKAKFADRRSDLLTALAVMDAYEENGWNREWASENFLNWKAVEEALSIRKQLEEILEGIGIEMNEEKAQGEAIGKAVTAGFIQNLARLGGGHAYFKVNEEMGNPLFIHPSSALFGSYDGDPPLITSTSIVETTKVFARDCQKVTVEWLKEIAPDAVEIERSEPRKSYFSDAYYVYERVLFRGNVVEEKEVLASAAEINTVPWQSIDVFARDDAFRRVAEVEARRAKKAADRDTEAKNEAQRQAQESDAEQRWNEYLERVEALKKQYEKYPGFGIYTFPIGKNGLPQDYRDNGKLYSLDQDFFEVLPEKKVPCWGYVTQWGHSVKVALLMETVERSKHLLEQVSRAR